MDRSAKFLFCLAALALACAAQAATAPLDKALARAAKKANPKVIHLAVEAATCATASGEPAARRLAVIDYSRPSDQPRLWVFDLETRKLVYEELVTHGKNSGNVYARRFSNEVDSFSSSLGLFRTDDTYEGVNGYSLRMSGLEPGINDRAYERAIVMHGAPYATRKFIKTAGRLGRSQGCPAVRPEIAHDLIDTLKDGQYVFAYYPDKAWLNSSPFLGCTKKKPETVAGSGHNAAGIKTLR